jgi:hypothetical protein
MRALSRDAAASQWSGIPGQTGRLPQNAKYFEEVILRDRCYQQLEMMDDLNIRRRNRLRNYRKEFRPAHS